MNTDEILRQETETECMIDSILVELERMKWPIQQLGEQIKRLRKAIWTTEQYEMYFAREWWKDGKYLYHVFPQDGNGKRKRLYVGCDALAVQIARAKVERWQRHRDMSMRLEMAISELVSYQATVGMMATRLKRSIGDNGSSVASDLCHQNGQG